MTKLEKLIDNCIKIKGTKAALAKYLGVHERNVYRWISGDTNPNAEATIEMCILVLKVGGDRVKILY